MPCGRNSLKKRNFMYNFIQQILALQKEQLNNLKHRIIIIIVKTFQQQGLHSCFMLTNQLYDLILM